MYVTRHLNCWRQPKRRRQTFFRKIKPLRDSLCDPLFHGENLIRMKYKPMESDHAAITTASFYFCYQYFIRHISRDALSLDSRDDASEYAG